MTLLELRKIGGFADLERDHERRAHPMILLEIIESMMLAQQDPTNTILVDRIKKSESMTSEQMVAEKIRALDICRDLDAEIAHISSMIDTNTRAVAGLTFVLARAGRLQSVHVLPAQAESQSRAGGTPDDMANLINTYTARIADLRARIDTLQASTPQVIGMRISSAPVQGSARASTSPIEQDPRSVPFGPQSVQAIRADATPSERYIARAVQVARIVHGIEARLEDLLDQCKKMRNALDVLFAQCVVLMSSRATIA